ncbi:MAG: F0F1 ATP synthase subunit B [Deltaproteobacteria bacterium]|nr:F0F1 ATP synthase subunit B [Deltaproteobacteria bacterium]
MRSLWAALALGAVLVLGGGTATGQPAGQPGAGGPAKAGALRPHRAGLPKARPAGAPHAKGALHGKGAAHAKAAPGGGHGGGHAVHVNWYRASPPPGESQPFLATLFNFIVLGLLLGRFGYPPIRDFVKARHETISKDLADAQRLRAEAEARLKEYEAKIANLDHEIATLLQGIRAEGEAERARIIAAADEQAQRLRRDAESTIAQDMKRARHEIEQEAVTAAIGTAERILRERITDADQRGFVERYLVSLATEAPGATPTPPGRGAA